MAGQFGKFLGELKQRHIFRVAIIYIVVAWVVIQAAALLEPALHLPDWFDTTVDIALILGFAPAMVIAWSAGPGLREAETPPRPDTAIAPELPASEAAEGPKQAKAEGLAARQKIKYCVAPDGARIAYAKLGNGPPVVKTANWMSHLEFDLATPRFQHWYVPLADDHTLIRYDERGCGLSDWTVKDISQEAFVQDLETVTDEIGIEKFALLGISQGCAVSIEYAVRHPDRVACLILFGGFACGQRRLGDPKLEQQFDAMKAMVGFHWGTDNPALRQYFTALMFPDATPDEIAWYNELQRRSASAENAARILEAVSIMDVRPILPQVKAPTLVIHAEHDMIADFERGRSMAASIPDARLVTLKSRNHILLQSDPAWTDCVQEVRDFLAEHWPGGA